MNILSNLSVQSLKLAVSIKQRIEDLEHELAKVLRNVELPVSVSLTVKRRKMSASARKAIGDAQRKRWAKQKGKTVKPAKRARKKMSDIAKAKISAAAKLRWKRAKAAGKTRL